jgi:hypothetical protein
MPSTEPDAGMATSRRPTRTSHARSHMRTLPVALLHAVADTERTPSAPLRFLSVHPASAARTQWLITSDYLDRLLANPEASASPRHTLRQG